MLRDSTLTGTVGAHWSGLPTAKGNQAKKGTDRPAVGADFVPDFGQNQADGAVPASICTLSRPAYAVA